MVVVCAAREDANGNAGASAEKVPNKDIAHTSVAGDVDVAKSGLVVTEAEASKKEDRADQIPLVASEDGEAGPSGSTTNINWENVVKAKSSLEVAKKVFRQGLQREEYAKVIDTLDQVCVILKKELGEFHRDTLDALFHYACVLLEYYQEGSSLMSTKANQVVRQYAAELTEAQANLKEVTEGMKGEESQDLDAEADEDEDDDDPESQSDGESLPGPEEQDGPSDVADMADVSEENGASAEASSASIENGTNEQPASSSAAFSEGEVQLKGNSKDTADADEAMDADEDDAVAISELKYAFEILETIRVGYDKLMKEDRATHEDKLRLSEIHYKLALCCAENGQQPEAILETERSVQLCEQICSLTDRDLAEAYFNLATINNMYTLLADAASNLEKAIAVLEARKAENERKLEDLQKDSTANAKELETVSRDQKEISELIPDLLKRLEEVYEETNMPATEARAILKQWKEGVIDEKREDEGLQKLADTPVNDITSMVRRKRPSDVAEDASKKLKGADGSAVVDGRVNGVGEKSTLDAVPEQAGSA